MQAREERAVGTKTVLSMDKEHRFPYEWRMSDGYPAVGVENHQSTVFGTFVCGGGSTMGYKLAGYHHLGGVELDPKIAEVYKDNHSPELLYNMDIREFNKIDLPEELFHLDLLDGSPPCSVFSRAGEKDKGWGKMKRFAEGQSLQTLDDLVFVYCDTIERLMPRCFVLENVKGLVEANSKSYTKRIVERLSTAYKVQVFCLNAALMGVPQQRERVFIVGHRREYDLPKLVLDFREQPIVFGEFMEKYAVEPGLSEYQLNLWRMRRPSDRTFGDIIKREYGKCSMVNCGIFHKDKVVRTLAAGTSYAVYDYPRQMTRQELMLAGTFPLDYKCKTLSEVRFMVGMAVPPVMAAQVGYEIWRQWINNIKSK